MDTISIKFDTNGLEISTDDRWQLSRIVDKALQDSGDLWVGCLYTKDTITIHALVEDEEQALSVIRSEIKEHPVYYHWHESIFVQNDNTAQSKAGFPVQFRGKSD